MACPHIPPPPKGAASLPAAPSSGFRQILRPGHWDWSDGQYSWVPAQWMTLLAPGRPLWRDSAWRPNQGACVWQPAHFVVQGEKAGPGF